MAEQFFYVFKYLDEKENFSLISDPWNSVFVPKYVQTHKTFALTITQIFNSKKFQDEVKKLSKLFFLWTFYENKFQAGETANSNRPEISLGANLDKGKILEQIEPKDFNEWLANMRYGV